ncbi:hypothetical protein JNW88_30175, partial [Micromonospora sp. ATA32]|nr:hypothetical protein [Micromonospora sp. ATA32]
PELPGRRLGGVPAGGGGAHRGAAARVRGRDGLALHAVAWPVLVLPSEGTREFHVMLWSTDGFPRTVNGLASFTPTSQADIRAASRSFPDAGSVAYLRAAGVRTVVLLPGYAAGTVWQDAASRPVAGLGIDREEVGDGIVFHLG